MVARRAHNPEVGRSNRSPATTNLSAGENPLPAGEAGVLLSGAKGRSIWHLAEKEF